MARRRDVTETCPECGAEFRAGRLACPECGSDASTGWKDEDEIQYQSIEIPDTLEELEATAGRKGHSPVFLIAAILALLGIVVFVLIARGF